MRRVLLFALLLPGSALSESRVDRHGDPLPDGAIARFGTIRYRIGSSRILYTYAVSPDGKSLVAEDARGITLWDLETGKPRKHFRPKPSKITGPPYELRFSPDGTKIARLAGKIIDVCDAKTGAELRRQELANGKAKTVAFSSDGSRICFALEDQNRICSFEITGKNPCKESDIEKGVWQFLNSAEFAVARTDGAIQLLDVGSGKIRCSFAETKRLANPQVALSADESRFVVMDQRLTTYVFDAVKGQLLSKFEPPAGSVKPDFATFKWNFAMSPDASVAFLSRSEHPTQRLNLKTGKWLDPLPRSFGGSIHASSDAKLLVQVESDGFVRRFDLHSLKELPSPEGFEDALFARPSPEGRRVMLQYESSNGYRLELRDDSGRTLWSVEPKEWASARWSPDGRWLACVGHTTVDLRDASSGEIVRTLRSTEPRREVTHVFFSSSSDRLVAPLDFGNAVAVFDIRTGKQLSLHSPQTGSAMSLSPDGDKLVYAREGEAARLYDLGSDRFIAATEAPNPQTDFSKTPPKDHGFRFSPEGSYVLCWRQMGNIHQAMLRSPVTLREMRSLNVTIADRAEFAISPNGLWLAVGNRANALTLYDVSSGAILGTWTGHKDYLTSIEFAGAGRLLTSSGDLTALLWDLRPDRLPTKGLWDAISSEDGVESFRAIWALAADPKGPELLRSKIVAPEPIQVEQVKRWIGDLGSNRFLVREEATKSLRLLGRSAEPLLREARSKSVDEEVRTRLDALLAQVRHERSHLEVIQARAVTAMELAGTDAAKKLLRDWAAGAAGARLTTDAKSALGRLNAK